MEDLFSFYGVTVILLAFIWSGLWALNSQVRREMAILGIFSLFLLPLAFTFDVRDPYLLGKMLGKLSFIDFAFAFFLSGLAGAIYHAAFGTHYHKIPKSIKTSSAKYNSQAQTWVMRLLLLFLAFSWGVVLVSLGLNVTLPKAVLMCAIVLTVYVVSHRHDLLADAIMSGLLTAFVVYVCASIASLSVGVDVLIGPVVEPTLWLGVPADLIIWSLAVGLALGPLYEYVRRYQVKT